MVRVYKARFVREWIDSSKVAEIYDILMIDLLAI